MVIVLEKIKRIENKRRKLEKTKRKKNTREPIKRRKTEKYKRGSKRKRKERLKNKPKKNCTSGSGKVSLKKDISIFQGSRDMY